MSNSTKKTTSSAPSKERGKSRKGSVKPSTKREDEKREPRRDQRRDRKPSRKRSQKDGPRTPKVESNEKCPAGYCQMIISWKCDPYDRTRPGIIRTATIDGGVDSTVTVKASPNGLELVSPTNTVRADASRTLSERQLSMINEIRGFITFTNGYAKYELLSFESDQRIRVTTKDKQVGYLRIRRTDDEVELQVKPYGGDRFTSFAMLDRTTTCSSDFLLKCIQKFRTKNEFQLDIDVPPELAAASARRESSGDIKLTEDTIIVPELKPENPIISVSVNAPTFGLVKKHRYVALNSDIPVSKQCLRVTCANDTLAAELSGTRSVGRDRIDDLAFDLGVPAADLKAIVGGMTATAMVQIVKLGVDVSEF